MSLQNELSLLSKLWAFFINSIGHSCIINTVIADTADSRTAATETGRSDLGHTTASWSGKTTRSAVAAARIIRRIAKHLASSNRGHGIAGSSQCTIGPLVGPRIGDGGPRR